ncbi:Hypothetical predicted protein, partial [Pelobates cultripes]
DGNGTKLTNPKLIVEEIATFYGALYNLSEDPLQHQLTPLEIAAYLDRVELPQLSSDQASLLSSKITPEEISKALRETPRHKAQGPDGFSTHYYKVFADQLLPHMTSLFNNIM